jgi:hypothetical protein
MDETDDGGGADEIIAAQYTSAGAVNFTWTEIFVRCKLLIVMEVMFPVTSLYCTDEVGCNVGNGDGFDVGDVDGIFVGLADGDILGVMLGILVGLTVGWFDGASEGAQDGMRVGNPVGLTEGSGVGLPGL